MSVDAAWFADLRGEHARHLNPVHFPDRQRVRARWDEIEAQMRHDLVGLDGARLAGTVEGLPVALALVHVLAHGVDHRAQLLAALDALGAPTFAQDLGLWLLRRQRTL
jgi:uncharacterized damage-inducible protein DinB